MDDKGAGLDADAKQPYSEFKMMPISMKLHMDQRKISKLLVACVNSPMPIEVRRVRIRPGAGESYSKPEQRQRQARPAPVEVIVAGPWMFADPARSAVAGSGGEEGGAGSYEIPVEIQGIIYIYNPPDLNTLGTGTAAEKPAETPAGAAPAAEAGAPGATQEAVPAKPAETAPAKP